MKLILGKELTSYPIVLGIGYAGTIYPYNRVEDFLEGLKLFVTMNPNANFKLMLFGIQSQESQLKRIEDYDSILTPYIESTPRLEKRIDSMVL